MKFLSHFFLLFFFSSSLKFIPRRMTRRTLHQNKIILQEFFIGESSPLAILIPGQFSLSPRSPKVYYITTRELHYLSTFSYPDLQKIFARNFVSPLFFFFLFFFPLSNITDFLFMKRHKWLLCFNKIGGSRMHYHPAKQNNSTFFFLYIYVSWFRKFFNYSLFNRSNCTIRRTSPSSLTNRA